MRKFIIEREIPNIGTADGNAIREVARKWNGIEKGGFPANRVVEVKRMMDPTSALA